MFGRLNHPHLRAVFALAPEPIGRRDVAIGIVGVVVPVLLGLLVGQTQLGLGIGLGAMILGGGVRAPSDPIESLLVALAAVVAALLIAGTGASDAALIALTAIAAVLGGYSRALAVNSVRFCIYLVLCVSVLEGASDRWLAAAAFAIGAGWNIALRRAIGGPAPKEEPSRYSHRQRIAAFRRRLRGWSAWHYGVRLSAGLVIASMVVPRQWVGRHDGWLLIAIVLLTSRTFERFPVKVTQRAIGVTLGVLLTWSIFAVARSAVVTVLLVAALAAAMPVLRARSYLLYSAAMTPIIMLVIDFGQPRDDGLLIDRLVATLLGSAIVLLVNLAVDRVMRLDERV